MESRTYRFVIEQDGTEAFRSEPLDACDAYELMSVSMVLHLVWGWEIERCSLGFHAAKDGVQRAEHLVAVGGEAFAPTPDPAMAVLA